MPPEDQGTEIADYAEVFRESTAGSRAVIVAGQAVNVWASLYFARNQIALEKFRPFVSKDLDLAGDRALVRSIAEVTRGAIRFSRPRTPMVGYAEIAIRGQIRKIEVLRDVKGLARGDLEDAVEVTAGGVRVRVLAPQKILRAKIVNTVEIDQTDRNDVRHVEIMIACVCEFVRDLLSGAGSDDAGQRDIVNVLEELRAVCLCKEAVKAAERWGFDFSKVWPREELENSGLEKIERFVSYRLDR